MRVLFEGVYGHLYFLLQSYFSLFLFFFPHFVLRFPWEVCLLTAGSTLCMKMPNLTLDFHMTSQVREPLGFLLVSFKKRCFYWGLKGIWVFVTWCQYRYKISPVTGHACGGSWHTCVVHKCILWTAWEAITANSSRVRTGIGSLAFLQCCWIKSHINSHPRYWKRKSRNVASTFLGSKWGQFVGCWGILLWLYSHMAGLPSLPSHFFLFSAISSRFFGSLCIELPPKGTLLSPLHITGLSESPGPFELTCLHWNWCTSELDGKSALWGILEPFQLASREK